MSEMLVWCMTAAGRVDGIVDDADADTDTEVEVVKFTASTRPSLGGELSKNR